LHIPAGFAASAGNFLDRRVSEQRLRIAMRSAIYQATKKAERMTSTTANSVEVGRSEMREVRGCVREHLPQMEQCTRCRADAIGLLAQGDLTEKPAEAPTMPATTQKNDRYIAVASSDGSHVNVHLGDADHLLVYDVSAPKAKLVGLRRIPPWTTAGSRWATLAGMLRDCSLLLVGGIGPMPKALLDQNGIRVRTVRGRIADILAKIDITVSDDDDSTPFVCGEACSGDQHGCDDGCGQTRSRSHHGCFGA
jgi:nitrogen fixation protein NifB